MKNYLQRTQFKMTLFFILLPLLISLTYFLFFIRAGNVFAKSITGTGKEIIECQHPACSSAVQDYTYKDTTDRCELYPDSCGEGGGGCPSSTNDTCENMSSIDCVGDSCPKVFYKVMISNSSATEGEVDTNLSDDVIAVADEGDVAGLGLIGLMKDFMTFFDQGGGRMTCKDQHRDYAFIYIPEGWWSFGVKANQSTNTPGTCYYCPGGSRACQGDNYLGNWVEKECPCDHTGYDCNSHHGEDPQCNWEYFYCDTRPNDPACTPDCGGQVWGWLGADGGGSELGPYTQPGYGTSSTLEERFDYLKDNNKWKDLVAFDSDTFNLDSLPINDSIWSERKYFSAGWYPIELSIDWVTGHFIYDPQFWWRKYDPITGTYSSECQYSDGSCGAKISPCAPSNMDCSASLNSQYIRGNTSNLEVNLGSIFDYNPDTFDVTLTTPVDPSVFRIDSHSVSDEGIITLTVTTGNVASSTPITLRVTAAAASGAGSAVCDEPVTITVTPVGDFWQVKDSDVTTTGSLTSTLPLSVPSTKFDLANLEGFPGIPVFSLDSGSNPFGDGEVSEKKWITQSAISSPVYSSYSSYNYAFFDRQVPTAVSEAEGFVTIDQAEVTTGNFNTVADTDSGYDWGKYTYSDPGGSLTINTADVDFSSPKKAVIFVNGNLNIQKNIKLAANSFIMFVVNGNINIGSDVGELAGVFFTNGQFKTGSAGENSDVALTVKGSVVAKDGVQIERDLPEGDVPTELFEFSPELLLQIPYDFGARSMKWKEVAPSSD